MPYRVVSLHDVVEFGDLDLSAYEGATVTVEGGRFVLVAPVTGDLVDAGHSLTTNPDLIDAGNAPSSNPDLFDGGTSS